MAPSITMPRLRCCAVAVCLSLIADGAQAQTSDRQGEAIDPAFTLGVVRGALTLVTDAGPGRAMQQRAWSVSGTIAVSPRVASGVRVSRTSWQLSNGITNTLSWYTVVAQLYAARSGIWRGAYLNAAIGLTDFTNHSGTDATDVGGSVGVAFEIPAHLPVAIVPYADYLFATQARLDRTGRTIGGRMLVFGVAARIR